MFHTKEVASQFIDIVKSILSKHSSYFKFGITHLKKPRFSRPLHPLFSSPTSISPALPTAPSPLPSKHMINKRVNNTPLTIQLSHYLTKCLEQALRALFLPHASPLLPSPLPPSPLLFRESILGRMPGDVINV